MQVHDFMLFIDGKYNFVDLYPGDYELSVANQGKWCWEYSSQKIYISEVQNKAPAFKRIGISFMVSSSHDTNVSKSYFSIHIMLIYQLGSHCR